MRKIALLLVTTAAALLLPGCGPRTMYLIPATPGNLSAVRECQRSYAVTLSYSRPQAESQKWQCLNTLEGISSKTLDRNSPLQPPDGCTEIDAGPGCVYFLCVPPAGR